jgi:hypothetical protein
MFVLRGRVKLQSVSDYLFGVYNVYVYIKMRSYLTSHNMYITLGLTAISVVAYMAVMNVFDFKTRGKEEEDRSS